jgi:hypothetical protein
MKKPILLIATVLFCITVSCRKKQKDVEIEFILVSGPSYCGESGQEDVCPRQLRVVSTGAYYVMDQPLDTSITNVPNWWNKSYVATLEEQKNAFECKSLQGDVDPSQVPISRKPIVKIKKIKLKE